MASVQGSINIHFVMRCRDFYHFSKVMGPFMADWGLKPGLKYQLPAWASSPVLSSRSALLASEVPDLLLAWAQDHHSLLQQGGRWVHPSYIPAFRAALALVAKKPTAMVAQPGTAGDVCFWSQNLFNKSPSLHCLGLSHMDRSLHADLH